MRLEPRQPDAVSLPLSAFKVAGVAGDVHFQE
jgi:hypothetical protein